MLFFDKKDQSGSPASTNAAQKCGALVRPVVVAVSGNGGGELGRRRRLGTFCSLDAAR